MTNVYYCKIFLTLLTQVMNQKYCCRPIKMSNLPDTWQEIIVDRSYSYPWQSVYCRGITAISRTSGWFLGHILKFMITTRPPIFLLLDKRFRALVVQIQTWAVSFRLFYSWWEWSWLIQVIFSLHLTYTLWYFTNYLVWTHFYNKLIKSSVYVFRSQSEDDDHW